MVFGIFYYLINGIAWYCFVLYCVVGFGARAVSRKTPIYFMYNCCLQQVYWWTLESLIAWEEWVKLWFSCFF